LIYNASAPDNATEMHSKFSGLAVKANDTMAYYSPNGGGYGSPLKRQPQKVLEDVLDGFYSAEHAREVYGVVVNLDRETVDVDATTRQRAAIAKGA
jgi:N-methylhydantoinase B